MIGDWLTARPIPTTKNTERKEMNEIVGAYIPGEMRNFTSANTVEIENKNRPRCLTKMLNIFSQVSGLSDHLPNPKKGSIVLLLCKLDTRKEHVNGPRFVVESMTTNVSFLRIETGMEESAKFDTLEISCGSGEESFPVPTFKPLLFPILRVFCKHREQSKGAVLSGKAENRSSPGLLLSWSVVREAVQSHSRTNHQISLYVVKGRNDLRKTQCILRLFPPIMYVCVASYHFISKCYMDKG